jgi:plastocyanin
MKTFYTFILSILFLPIFSQIVITEISYNPPESGNDSLEYIEIYNAADTDYDLTGASFSDGFEHTFENEILTSKAFICVAINSQAMQNVFGKDCIQWTGGALKNGGELIRLVDAQDNELDQVEFMPASPWPSSSEGTAGNGASIVLCDYTLDNADGANWTAAKNSIGKEINGFAVKGSPGQDNAASCEVTADHIIEARPDNSFTPADITINPGELVRWVNMGGFHNVNGDKGTFPDNPESFGNGGASADMWTYDFTFFNEGVYEYQCDPHSGLGMKGTIQVGIPKTFPLYDIGVLRGVDAAGIPDSFDVSCEIIGTVHGVNISTSGGLLFWLIDDSHDGISIFNSNNTLAYNVNEGDELSIKGTVSSYNGLTQFNAEVINLNGTGTLQTPIIIDSLEEQYESQLVTLEGFMFDDASLWKGDGSSFNMQITNGTYTGTMRISEFTDLANSTVPLEPFNATGLVNQFDFNEPYFDFYQLMPRSTNDITSISNTADEDLFNVSIHPNPSNGFIRLAGIQNPDEVCLYNHNGQLLQVWNKPDNEIYLGTYEGLYILSITKDKEVTYKKLLMHK